MRASGNTRRVESAEHTPSAVAAVAMARPSIEALFRDHVDRVHRTVARLLGPASAADVDDLTQQVFIAIDRALPGYRGDSAVTTWVYGITARVVLHHLRGWRRYRAMIARFEASSVFERAPAGVDESVAQRQALRRVWSALLRIAPERRVVLILHAYEGMSTAEIARVLEIGEEAVRSRLRRARKELADRLGRYEEARGD